MRRIALFTFLPCGGQSSCGVAVAVDYRYSGTSRRARLGSSNGILPARH
jgi:hypothetical protein